jgi:hypothetical protein
MAENESLDLGSSYAKRWDAAFTAVQSGDLGEKVAPKVSKALYGGVRKALKQLQEHGVTLADLVNARDSRQRLHLTDTYERQWQTCSPATGTSGWPSPRMETGKGCRGRGCSLPHDSTNRE